MIRPPSTVAVYGCKQLNDHRVAVTDRINDLKPSFEFKGMLVNDLLPVHEKEYKTGVLIYIGE